MTVPTHAQTQALLQSGEINGVSAEVPITPVVLVDAAGRLVSTIDNGDGTANLSSNNVDARVNNGRAFIGGSGNLALTAAGNIRLTLQNPAGSGVSLYVFKLSIFATGSAFGSLYTNPTVGLPTAAMLVNNANFGSAVAAQGLMKADVNTTTALSGGVSTNIVLGVPNGTHVDYLTDLPYLVVPAGTLIGVNIPFAGAANAAINCYWYEA